MTRKEFVAICVEHNVEYEIDPRYDITIIAPKGKTFDDIHQKDYQVDEDETMSDAYQSVVDDYINYLTDCEDLECDCHNEPDRPVVVPEVPKPVVHRNTHPEVIEEKVVWNEVGMKDGIEFKHAQRYIFNDGGRQDTGFKGHTGDCVTRSIAIVTGKPYKEVYDALNKLSESEYLGKRMKRNSNARTGVHRKTYQKYLESLGYQWIPTMQIGQGCKTHLRSDELPTGRLIVRVTKHITTMIDGVINDTYDCSRNGNRCVYGYFIKP